MKIFAHRGLSGFYPENTMLSFKKCINLDLYGIELDVQKTKDNHLVVIHDEKVDRTFNSTGYVKNMTLKELKSLNSSFNGYENNPECKIPTLKEVLILFKPTKFIINIELKNNKINYKNLEEDVVNLIKELKMERRVIISSFKMKSVKKIKKICPKLKTAYLISEKFYKLRIKNLIFYKMVSNKCSFANPSFVLIDKQFIKKCHGRDLEVLSYTVNNIENYQNLSNLKCD